jgi:hypothetical protein
MIDNQLTDPCAILASYGWEPEVTDGRAPSMWMHRDAVVDVGGGTFTTHHSDHYEFSPAELRSFAQLAEESGNEARPQSPDALQQMVDALAECDSAVVLDANAVAAICLEHMKAKGLVDGQRASRAVAASPVGIGYRKVQP